MASALGCGGEEASVDGGAVEPPRRIVLITIDTLRADHLPFYGYPRDTTPFLAELARRSVVFDRVVAASSHTVPSHTTLFTGLHMPQHRVLMNPHDTMDPSIRTLTQLFADAGYTTIGLPSVVFMGVLERGFDVFFVPGKPRKGRGGPKYTKGGRMVGEALAQLALVERERPVFLWLHLYDVHQPQDAPQSYIQAMSATSPDEMQLLRSHWREVQGKTPESDGVDGAARFAERQHRYDASIAYVDWLLRRFYEGVRELGLMDGSLWIITSDHGEGLRSHGYSSHGREIYQEQVLVPFLVHDPDGGLATGRVGGLWHHVDLYPTLAEMLGAPTHGTERTLAGVSMLPALRGRGAGGNDSRVAYVQRRQSRERGRSAMFERGPIYSLQGERFKYVVRTHGDDELYDLAEDPGELTNLAGEGSELERMWRQKTREAFEAMTKESGDLAVPEVSDEHREVLRALGYVE